MKTTLKTTTIARLGLLACAGLVVAMATVMSQNRVSGAGVADNPVLSDATLTERLYHPAQMAQPKDLVNSIIVRKNGQQTSFDTFHDGTSEDVHFWKDDTHKAAAEDYFSFGTDHSRQLRSEATFIPAGEPGQELYKTHSVYRQGSGLLERHGHLERDGRYEQTYMMDDGQTVLRDRWFDSQLRFVQESIYKWNEAHTETYVYARVVQGDFEGKIYASYYREDGSRSATLTIIPDKVEGQMFGPDGSTLLAEWGQDGNVLGHFYYLLYENGSRTPTKEWENNMGRMTVLVLNPDTHTVILRQVWKERQDPSLPGGKRYLLVRADQLDTANDTIVRVNMSNNGSHPAELVIPGKDGDTYKELDATGKKVVKTEKRDASGTALSSLLAPQSMQEELVEIDPSILLMPEHPEVPTYDDANAPPRVYDYR